MKKIYCIITTILLIITAAFSLSAQDLTIGSGTTFSLGSSILSLSGNWSNSGTFTAGSGTVVFNGASGNQTITNTSGESFYNLTVNKAAGDVQLANNITISGTLTCTSGDVDLNGHVLTLTGTLSETVGNTVKGTSGYITCSSDLNAPSGVNPHNIGLAITSAANPGTTTIIRGHAAQNGSGNSGMLRYFEITPASNSSLDASIVFYYDDSELNSIDESTFEMFSSTDNGSTWTKLTGALNTSSNTYSVSGLNSLSRYTLASSSAPLPVELASFTASVFSKIVLLKWQTATEVNNYGFEIERKSFDAEASSLGHYDWQKIGFVEGYGNSNSVKEYSFTDKEIKSGSYSYRLKQIDTDGSFTYSEEIAVETRGDQSLPTEFELYQNYPNPFNPTTTIKFGLPKNSHIMLEVINVLGEKVAELINDEMVAGYHQVNFEGADLSSGVYIYKITAGDFVSTKKLLLMK